MQNCQFEFGLQRPVINLGLSKLFLCYWACNLKNLKQSFPLLGRFLFHHTFIFWYKISSFYRNLVHDRPDLFPLSFSRLIGIPSYEDHSLKVMIKIQSQYFDPLDLFNTRPRFQIDQNLMKIWFNWISSFLYFFCFLASEAAHGRCLTSKSYYSHFCYLTLLSLIQP